MHYARICYYADTYPLEEIYKLKDILGSHFHAWMYYYANMIYSDVAMEYNRIVPQKQNNRIINMGNSNFNSNMDDHKIFNQVDLYVQFCETEMLREKLIDITKYIMIVHEKNRENVNS